MNGRQLITIAVVSTLLIGGGAALGAASPAEQASDTAPDADEHETAPDDGGDAADDRAGNADGVGPSDGLPEQVPGHVSEIHDRIDSFLGGSIDNLGESLGGGGAADDAADGENGPNMTEK
jgi:hypothetical protein